MSPPAADKRLLLAGAAAVLVLVLWSARGVLLDPAGLILGDRPDTIHHVWGQWWMAQSGAEGGLSTWTSYPSGEYGSVLCPLGNLLVRPVEWLGGAVLAYNLLSVLYLLFDALAVGLLARRVARSDLAGVVAALAMVVARPVIAHVALGNTEGAAIGWVALVAWAGLPWARGENRLGAVVGLLCGVAVIENPYSLPILAIVAPALALRRLVAGPGRWRQLALAAVAGPILPGLRLWQVGEGLGGNFMRHAAPFDWLGFTWTVWDPDWSLAGWQLLWPWPRMQFPEMTLELYENGGFAFVGLVALCLALGGGVLQWRRALPWLGLALLFFLLGLGSTPLGDSGPPGLFLLANSVIVQVLPALTQPLRFLAFGTGALAVAAGVGAARLPSRPWVAPLLLALLVVEGFTLGGPSIRIPVIDTRGTECLAALEGPVHTLTPTGPTASANGAALLLQLVHGQPGTHVGVGGWTRVDEADARSLEERGVRWVLVPEEGLAATTCGGWSALPLSAWTPELEQRFAPGQGPSPQPRPLR